MGAMVLLRHDLPDASFHYDWLLQRDDHLRPALIAFRVVERIDVLTGKEFTAERLQDHRDLYLTHEGALSGARGSVRRVAAGTCRILAETSDRLDVEVTWGGPTTRLRGRPHGHPSWQFRMEQGTGVGGSGEPLPTR